MFGARSNGAGKDQAVAGQIRRKIADPVRNLVLQLLIGATAVPNFRGASRGE